RPDFFRMPQPWPTFPDEPRALPGARDRFNHQEGPLAEIGDSADRPLPEWSTPNPLKWAHQAIRLESSGRFHQAAAAWVHYQRERRRLYLSDSDLWRHQEPAQAIGLADRIASLEVWRSPGDTPALRDYLRARDLVNTQRKKAAGPILARLTQEPYRTRAQYL